MKVREGCVAGRGEGYSGGREEVKGKVLWGRRKGGDEEEVRGIVL